MKNSDNKYSDFTIRFQNTLSGSLEPFNPISPGEVRMYACGPTVYDYAHIGNFRAFVFEDLLRRFLEFTGYKVKHVMNLTDVDDKTIAGAQRDKLALEDYTAKYIQAFNEDIKTLNCLPPAVQPRATREIKRMQELIQTLIDRGKAYVNDGSVYFRVVEFKGYGKLSKKDLEMNITGASDRMDADEYESKEQVSDFVLWKKAKDGESEIGAAWDSPWGKGRPGWHIECSAMSIQELGEQLDIHAGGEDLVFPHHENEIAQSEGSTGKDPFVKYWLHCKFLLLNGEKMSKSKGNFFTLRDLLAKGYDAMVIRCALMNVHYRASLNFTEEGLLSDGEFLTKVRECYHGYYSRIHLGRFLNGPAKPAEDLTSLNADLKRILEFLSEDLNISAAFSVLANALKKMNRDLIPGLVTRDNAEQAIRFFDNIDDLLGLNISKEYEIPKAIIDLLERRSDLKKEKRFEEADTLKKEIENEGWRVKDHPLCSTVVPGSDRTPQGNAK